MSLQPFDLDSWEDGGDLMQTPVRKWEFNEADLDRTGCPPIPPRRHTAMPSHICHAGSQGRARTGHSSLLATPVYT